MYLDKVLGAQPDFKHERPALQHVVEGRGPILLLPPAYNLKIAGIEVEHSWVMSKVKFRRDINDEKARLH